MLLSALANHGLTQMDADRPEMGVLAGEAAAALYAKHSAALVNAALSYNKITQYSGNDQIVFHRSDLESYVPAVTPSTTTTSSSTTAKQSEQQAQQQGASIPRNEKLLIRSLYTFERAMIAGSFTAAKAAGYAGNTLYTYSQHLASSQEMYNTLLQYASRSHGDSDDGVSSVPLLQQEGHRVVTMLKEVAANQIETSVLLGK
jgi:hypothetical protein